MHKNKWIGVLPTILRTENTTLPNLKSILIRYKIFKVYANEGMLSCSIMRGCRDSIPVGKMHGCFHSSPSDDTRLQASNFESLMVTK